MRWSQVLTLLRRACSEQDEERRVLVVLAESSFHVQELLGQDAPEDGDLLGFIAFCDDPQRSQRTEETRLIFVRPEQVVRIEVSGFDPRADAFGFSG